MRNDLSPLFPETWKSPHLEEVSEVRYGLGQPPQQADNGVPMIRATNVKRGRISEEGLIRIKRSAIPESRNPYLKAGDVIVVRSGAYTGDVAMITEQWAGSVAGYDLVVSPGKSVDSAFCAYALLSSAVQRHFKGLSNRAAQAHLNRQQLQTTPIPLPPLPEQTQIAHILSTVQRAIEAQERIIQTTSELKKALMNKLFTEGLRNEPQKQTAIGPIPESWTVVELGSIAKVGNGSTPKRANKVYWEGGTIPWLNSTKIHERFITEADQFVTPLYAPENLGGSVVTAFQLSCATCEATELCLHTPHGTMRLSSRKQG